MEAGTVPDKVTISHRGARYEIGRGKRYYGIWVAGAPDSAPIDRWPETREGWAQAWTRFVTIETPGTIHAAGQPRPGLRLPGFRFPSEKAPAAGPPGKRTALIAGVLLALGVIIGVAGLFPDYFTGQSLASQSDQLVPHLIYLAGWAVSAVLVLRGRGMARTGALLGTGLSAVTLGLFLSDLGQVFSGASGLEPGIIISVIGWAACTAGAAAALAIAPAAPGGTAAAAAGTANAGTPEHGAAGTPEHGAAGTPEHGAAGTAYAGDPGTGEADGPDTISLGDPGDPDSAGGPAAPDRHAGTAAMGQQAATMVMDQQGGTAARRGGPVRPAARHAGPAALLVLGAIGTAAAFAPSWDSYRLTATATGATQTVTAGNAFAQPGWVITGDVLVMVAVVAIAALAALWHPVRQGAALLAGAIIPMAAQAISAIIQIGQPTAPGQLGISPAQATALGLTIRNGLTPIFWVYCVFVIALLISCAWLLTEPARPSGTAAQPAWAGPAGGLFPPPGSAVPGSGDRGDAAPAGLGPQHGDGTGHAGTGNDGTGNDGTGNDGTGKSDPGQSGTGDGNSRDGGGEDEENSYA
jgi:hypothetical protein